MKWLACFWAAAAMAWAQSGGALLTNQEALKLEQRTVQLMESTGLAVPGLARGQDTPLCVPYIKRIVERNPVLTPPANNHGKSVPPGSKPAPPGSKSVPPGSKPVH